MMIYHAIIKRATRKAFEQVNKRDYEALLKKCIPTVHHEFSGKHALGGQRNDVASLRTWFQRLGVVLPDLHLTIHTISVLGWPWKTLAIAQWKAKATLANGDPYYNSGVHFIKLQWGKVVSLQVYEDSQAVDEGLQKQKKKGIKEADSQPIVS